MIESKLSNLPEGQRDNCPIDVRNYDERLRETIRSTSVISIKNNSNFSVLRRENES